MSTAKVIPFPQASQPSTEARKSMYSDKFKNGYVMSSLLYRKEVYPFLSDAARNVYAELESRINGYNKESDFVSYSQLQGGDLPGARQMGRTTVSDGLKELIKLGVISVHATGKRGMKSYVLNEISLKDRFTNKTSTVTRLVSLKDQNQSDNKTSSSPVTGHTIDNPLDNLYKNKKKGFSVDNLNSDIFANSSEYHLEDKKKYTFRELANVYTIKSDFIAQAKSENSELTDEKILSELKGFAQWTTGKDQTTAQGWMNYWIYRIQNLKSKTTPTAKPAVSKKMTDAQIDMFSKKLCNHHDFASVFSNIGETQKQFESRVAKKLRDSKDLKAWHSYLKDVGFAGELEDFA